MLLKLDPQLNLLFCYAKAFKNDIDVLLARFLAGSSSAELYADR